MKEIKKFLDISNIKRICDGYEDDKVKNTKFYQTVKNLHRHLKGIYESIYENTVKKFCKYYK